MAPWYVYVIALVVALPIFFLLAVAGLGLLRTVLSWVLSPDPSAAPKGNSVKK